MKNVEVTRLNPDARQLALESAVRVHTASGVLTSGSSESVLAMARDFYLFLVGTEMPRDKVA